MAYRTVNETSLTSVANKIRTKTGSSSKLTFPSGFESAIDGLTNAKLVKVGEGTVTYTSITVSCKNHPKWSTLTVDDIFVIPKNFIAFSTEGTETGMITCGTYNFKKSYSASNGTLTISRESVPGKVGINFDCEFYAYK